MMRRLWLRAYLWFNGIVVCDHAAAGTRYCVTCEEIASNKRLAKHLNREEHLEQLRNEFWRKNV